MNNYPHPHLFVGCLSPDKIKQIVKNIKLSPNDLFKVIFNALGVTKEQIQSESRKREIVIARQIFVGLQKEYGSPLTLKKLGKIMNRDHSTVIYARSKFNTMVETKDKIFNQALDLVRKEIENV